MAINAVFTHSEKTMLQQRPQIISLYYATFPGNSCITHVILGFTVKRLKCPAAGEDTVRFLGVTIDGFWIGEWFY
jgi:hypothetical protein